MEQYLKQKAITIEKILESTNLLDPAYFVGQLELIEELLSICAHKEEPYNDPGYYLSADDL
jgi:hypothetical protein